MLVVDRIARVLNYIMSNNFWSAYALLSGLVSDVSSFNHGLVEIMLLQVSPVIHSINAVPLVESKINGERRESASF